MKDPDKPLVIFGAGDLARVLSRSMRSANDSRQVAFCVDRAFLEEPVLEEFEVIAFEDIESRYPPEAADIIVATGYEKVNQTRAALVARCRAKGYRLASFIGANVMRSEPISMGENCLIFDGAVLHPFVTIGNNVVIWGSSHVGHDSVLEDHVFLASAGVAGRSTIGEATFLGSNSFVSDQVKVGKRNIIGAGVTLTQDTEDEQVFRSPRPTPSRVSSSRLWR